MKNQKILISLVVLVSIFAAASFVMQKTNLMAYISGSPQSRPSDPSINIPLPKGYVPPASSSPVYTPPPTTVTPTPVRVTPTPTRTVPSGVAPAVPTVRPAIVPTKTVNPPTDIGETMVKENGLGSRVLNLL